MTLDLERSIDVLVESELVPPVDGHQSLLGGFDVALELGVAEVGRRVTPVAQAHLALERLAAGGLVEVPPFVRCVVLAVRGVGDGPTHLAGHVCPFPHSEAHSLPRLGAHRGSSVAVPARTRDEVDAEAAAEQAVFAGDQGGQGPGLRRAIVVLLLGL